MSESTVSNFRLPSPLRLGWIGTGVMGEPLCHHLLQAGYPLRIYSRTQNKARDLLQQGAQWANSPRDLLSDTDVIFTMVGFPEDVRSIYFGPEGLLSKVRAGQVFIDLTTSQPSLAQKIGGAARAQQAFALDSPVSGGDIGARNGTLSIMVGGALAVFEAMKPILSILGKTVVYQGSAGCGQHAKMCNQITIAGTMIGVCEGLLYAHRSGLDGETLLQSISKGAASCWTLEYLVPKILNRDFTAGFFVDHFIKDMGIALDEANRMGLLLPGLATVRKLYLTVQAHGHGRSGTHALLLALEELSPMQMATGETPSFSSSSSM